ncbi:MULTISPECIES: DUF1707 SHOCT-like domain-containing protein [Streptomyces]|uniref:DUF1707 SHOCT-like domain-containing protein n=1 Tax=Streptomyces TaxID=1883 RepID=UPI0004BD6AC7|nr:MULTISPECIES: DUF1707 domain-containing protein [Streptomyces]NNG85607.1 DUF1707 and DUF2154 domain-containing protein [Streptomyces cacaoi]QHF98909.1 DUF1707 and DUF2154 domain-containing protein [Streptomyces sp. NHF165]
MTEETPRTSLDKQPSAGRVPAPAPVAQADVRASDADRDRVADILREALAEGRLDAEEHSERVDAVYAAKTMGELEPLVRDLPAGQDGSRSAGGQSREPAGERPYSSASAKFTAAYSTSDAGEDDSAENLVAIFGGSVRKGRWRVPRKVNAFALFGGVEIDLTEALFEHRHVVINATAIFGGVEIRVPENVTLQQKGSGIFGGFDVKVTESPDPEAPTVLVQGAGIFGGVEAKPKRGKFIENLRERFRKEM